MKGPDEYTPNQIITFRMTTGEEILAKYILEKEDHFLVEQPLILMQGQQGLGMVPAIFSGNIERVPLYKSCIMMSAPSKDDAVDHYREQTTGLQVPQKQIITG